jgi:AcrR family transcriptional regulator
VTSVAVAPRQSASERRIAIIDAAVEEFAMHGYSGASTETIARRVGISQPYIFRLFGTKKDLFLAATDHVHTTIFDLFVTAAEGAAQRDVTPLKAMEEAYSGLLSRKHELLMLLQSFAAGGDPEIQTKVRANYQALIEEVSQRSGAPQPAIFQFFAAGMMLTVAAALDMPELCCDL